MDVVQRAEYVRRLESAVDAKTKQGPYDDPARIARMRRVLRRYDNKSYAKRNRVHKRVLSVSAKVRMVVASATDARKALAAVEKFEAREF